MSTRSVFTFRLNWSFRVTELPESTLVTRFTLRNLEQEPHTASARQVQVSPCCTPYPSSGIVPQPPDETHNCGYRIHLDVVSPQKSCTVRSVTALREAQSYCLPSGIHSKAPANQGYLQPRGCCNTADTPPLSEFQGNKSGCQPRV